MAKFFNNRRNILLTFVSALILAAVGGWLLSPMVLVVQSPTGKVGLVLPVSRGDSFSLRFIHSVHLTPVWENFTVTGIDSMSLISTEYESYGVGMPSLPSEGKFEQLNDRFRLSGLNRHFTEISLRVWPKNKLTLLHDNREYSLYEMFEPESLVFIRVRYNYFGLLYPRPSNG